MSAPPLVTVVTPSFNQAQYIRGTIESVLSQDYPHLEYIIMDGGSTDNTAAVVKEYSSRLTWISERDKGQSDAINKGFRRARGQIVSWLNSDDIILPGAVSRAVETLESDSTLGAVYGEGYQMDEQGNLKCRFPWTEPFNLWKLVHVLDYILQQTVYFRKSVLGELGHLDESLNWGMDWEILMRIGKRYGVAYVPEPLGAIREYATAKSFSGGWQRFSELLAIMRRHGTRRWPPGYWFYGLSTLQQIAGRRLGLWRSSPAGPLVARLNTLLCAAADRGIRWAHTSAQGYYRDGWAAPRLYWMLPCSPGTRIVLRGRLPVLGESVLPRQSLRLLVAGREIGLTEFGPGEFTLEAPAPVELRQNAIEIVVEAARHFVPARSGMGSDSRRLCYMLREIACK